MFGLHLSGGGTGVLRRGTRVAAAVAVSLGGLSFAWAVPGAPPAAAALNVAPGQVVAWGYNGWHQTEVPAEALSGVTRVSAGCTFSLALKGGKVIAWGDNSMDQTNVPAAAQSGVVAISAGCNHSLALKSNGTIVAWGNNTYHQLNVPSLSAGYKWFAIAAGWRTNVAIATDGTHQVYMKWGEGSGVTATPPPAADVENGQFVYVILKKDGTVAPHGTTPASLLTPPSGLSNVTAIDVGWQHALALKSDGSVVAWGENGYDQIDVPSGLGNVTVVAAGAYHSLALKSDGTIVGWGRNTNGQTDVPPAPSGLHYTYMAGGYLHSLAIASASVPGAPTNVAATATDGAATISWQAPASDGGSPITLYTVTSTPDGKKCTSTGALTCSIGGLTNGTGYVFTVRARNVAGEGPASAASSMVYPEAAPTAPPLETPSPEPGASESAGPSERGGAQPSQSPGSGGSGDGGGGLDAALVLIVGVVIGLGVALVAVTAFMLGRGGRGQGGPTAAPPAPPPASPPPARPRKPRTRKPPTDDDTWNEKSPF